jgi:hypothetical protein
MPSQDGAEKHFRFPTCKKRSMAIKARLKRAAVADTGEAWRSRIVGEGDVAPSSLEAHPNNWRKHPDRQQRALAGVLSKVGWVQRVVVNKRTGRIIDGHARVELAVKRGETSVPVVWVDLSEEDEKLVLATLDPIGALAEADDTKLEELLGSVLSSGDNADLLGDTFDDAGDLDEIGVTEIETSTVHDEFWISVRGPLPSQPDALEALKRMLERIPGCTVDVGGLEGL